MSNTATLPDLSVEQLQAALKEKKKAAKADKEAQRIAYECERENTLNTLGKDAMELFECIRSFKADAFDKMHAFRDMMARYGTLVGGANNKGSFSIKNDDFKIEYATQVIKGFDERAKLAESKMKLFLDNFIKKRDKKTHALINGLLERNEQTGDFDIGLLNRLYKMEDQYEDPNWKDAIRLFKESYNPTNSAQYIRFSKMGANGDWQSIVLDFAKVKI